MGTTALFVLKWAGLALMVAALAYGGLTAFGAWRWTSAVRALNARLDVGRTIATSGRYTEAELSGLPAPVQRFFRIALTEGQRIVTGATLVQSGLFNLGTTAAQWKPFTARQRFTTGRPGFVWDAKIMMFRGVPVRVVDAYVAGEGLLRPTILGLFGMGRVQGRGEIARGELLRHFAECVWFPTALLPSQGIVWQAVDDTSATATMTDCPIAVTMLFRFGADGLISAIHVDGRATKVGDATVLMPWECRMSNYQRQDGMRIPMTGEALYLTPQGEKPYFKGTIDTLVYSFAG